MYRRKFKCPQGHIKEHIQDELGGKPYCMKCFGPDLKADTEIIEEEVVGECEECRSMESLYWDYIEEDSPHHGTEAECEKCGAVYYDDGSGRISFVNEQAQKNYPNLKQL